MNPALADAASTAITFLSSIVGDAASPGEAMAAFAGVRQRHPGIAMQLLWEPEVVADSYHFDVVLSAPKMGAVTVTFTPERGLPFIVRGCRGREDQIASVNGEAIGSTNAIVELEIAHDTPLIEKLIHATLIRQAIEARSADEVEPSPDELQAAVDGFRKRNGLYRSADAVAWLNARGLTQRALEERLANEVRAAKLRDLAVGGRVREAFEADPARFDVLCVYELSMKSAEAAHDLAKGARARDGSLRDAAHAAVERGDATDLLVRRLRRCELDGGLQTALGPVVQETNGSARVIFADHVEPAVLDEETRVAAAEWLFRGWLAERRAGSHVKWLWGEAR